MKINRIPPPAVESRREIVGGDGRLVLLVAAGCAVLEVPAEPAQLVVKKPDLAHPLTETYPASAEPEDPVKKAVLTQINADRAAHGLPPVAWDEGASRVGDTFTADQVKEGTNGHFLMNGLPPYARTGLAGVFGMGKENVVAWTTTGQTFHEPALELALEGQAAMLAEKPPNDGHRLAILDPDATHVGVGWAQGGGQFRKSEEFMTRRLAELTLQRVAQDPSTVLVSGKTVAGQTLRFVTLAVEPLPHRLTKAQAHARSRYSYPEPGLRLRARGLQVDARRRRGHGRPRAPRPGRRLFVSFHPRPARPLDDHLSHVLRQ